MNYKEKIIFGIPFSGFSFDNTVGIVIENIKKKNSITYGDLNAHIINLARNNPKINDLFQNFDILNVDGMSVYLASKFLGVKVEERVAGIDLFQKLVEVAYKHRYKCFFFGAKEEVVKKVVENFSRKYSPDIICGYHNGYYAKEEESVIAKQIASSGAQLLFVATTSPQKELFLSTYREDLCNVCFKMGVGGSFDVIAGVTNRAPKWLQKLGMEWFYRLVQEPGRLWRRYLIGNAQFIWATCRLKFKI